jgi:hypothetical protein
LLAGPCLVLFLVAYLVDDALEGVRRGVGWLARRWSAR